MRLLFHTPYKNSHIPYCMNTDSLFPTYAVDILVRNQTLRQ